MDRLVLLSGSASVAADIASRRGFVIAVLREFVKANPGLTWGDLAAEANALSAAGDDLGLSCPAGGMNGWLTNALKTVGGALDPITFGGASKVILGTKRLGEDVFARDKVKDSLERAARGVADDALDRLLDALPFGLGSDIRTGNVVNRFWVFGGIAVGLVLFLLLRRR